MPLIMNFDNNLVKSWKVENDGEGETKIIESYLNGGNPESGDMCTKERLEELLFRCFNFTSKLYGYDELSGEDNKDLYCKKLRGSDSITDHHCAGSIQYNKKNEHLFLYLEIMFWNKYKVVHNHTFKNKEINIKRSSGSIEKGFIDDYGFRFVDKNNDFMIKVLMENKSLEKYVPLEKIRELNPELEMKLLLDTIEDLPDWINDIYIEWQSFILQNFKY